jgi:16S rRNA (uracil1498-N3)-methyltransferase
VLLRLAIQRLAGLEFCVRRRFFIDSFEGTAAILRGDAAEHLGRVLRAEPGQLYELSDGHRVWLGRIERVALSKRGQSRIDFALVEPLPAREPGLRIALLISLVKFDRFEWCLEKATELGASEITPLAAARTDKPLIAAAGKRRARWERILLESAQQSRRLRPPILHAASGGAIMTPGEAFAHSAGACKIVLSERRDALPLREVLSGFLGGRSSAVTESRKKSRDFSSDIKESQTSGASAPEEDEHASAALAIGPEGGWTDEEIVAARSAGFAEASLGENILRTETAVLASLAILGFAVGR